MNYLTKVTDEEIKRIAVENITILFRYALALGQTIGLARAFSTLSEIFNKHHIAWAEKNVPRLCLEGRDCISAEKFLEAYFKDTRMFTFGQMMPSDSSYASQITYAEKTPQRIVVHNRQWCPIVEVANTLGLQPGFLCREFIFPEWQKVINTFVNPRIKVKLGKVRPEADFCEEIYELAD